MMGCVPVEPSLLGARCALGPSTASPKPCLSDVGNLPETNQRPLPFSFLWRQCLPHCTWWLPVASQGRAMCHLKLCFGISANLISSASFS